MRLAYDWHFYFKTMTKEIWKIVPQYENYMVSNLGNVKSLNYRCKGYEKLLKQVINRSGYCSVGLHKDGKQKSFGVQVIVAMAFLGHVPCGHKIEVDHKNDIKTDNRLENLQLLTIHRHKGKTHLGGTSKHTGVSWVERSKKWVVKIKYNGRIVHGGLFKDEDEAGCYYQKCLNEIEKGIYVPHEKHVPTSKTKGVCWLKANKKWVAYFAVKGKKTTVGYFLSEEEAIIELNKAKKNANTKYFP